MRGAHKRPGNTADLIVENSYLQNPGSRKIPTVVPESAVQYTLSPSVCQAHCRNDRRSAMETERTDATRDPVKCEHEGDLWTVHPLFCFKGPRKTTCHNRSFLVRYGERASVIRLAHPPCPDS